MKNRIAACESALRHCARMKLSKLIFSLRLPEARQAAHRAGRALAVTLTCCSWSCGNPAC
jgi:hypothetical protein